MTQREEKRGVIPLYIKAELVPEKCNVVELCEACERVSGHGSIDGATLLNRLWRVLPFNEVSRAKLLIDGISLNGKHLQFEGKNPFLHPSGSGEAQTTKLIIKNLPFSYSQAAVERNLIKEGFKLRGKMTWMKGRNRRTGHLSDFRDGRRAVFIDLPTGKVNQTIMMGSFRARIEYPEMKTTCYRCLQEGHTARNCTGEEVCHSCRKPGHRKDQCPGFEKNSDRYSDSEDEEEDVSVSKLPPSGNITVNIPPLRATPQAPCTDGENFLSASTGQNAEVPKTYAAAVSPGKHPRSKASAYNKTMYLSDIPSETNKDHSLTGNKVTACVVVEPVVDNEVNDKRDKASPRNDCVANATAGSTVELVSKEVSDSPMTEFIESVQFAELPGASRQVMGQNMITSLAPSQALCVIEETPKRGTVISSDNPSKCSKSLGPESIWDTPLLGDDSEEALLILASQMIEKKNDCSKTDVDSSATLSFSQDSENREKRLVSEQEVLSAPGALSPPQATDQANNAYLSPAPKLATHADSLSPSVSDAAVSDETAKGKNEGKSASSSLIKIKRAFSAIISPPSEKSKDKAEGPVSKKKN